MGWTRDALKSCLTLAAVCGVVLEGFSLGYAQHSPVPAAETRAIAEPEGRTTGDSATTIVPSLRLAERYDSNVFFVKGQGLEDYVTTVSPQLTVAHQNPWVEVRVRGGATSEVYAKNPGLNYVGANGMVDLNLDNAMNALLPGLGLHISNGIFYTPQPPAFAAPTSGNQISDTFVQGLQARRANSFSNMASVEASYFFLPHIGVSSTYTDSRLRFGKAFATPTGLVQKGEFINTNFQTLTSGFVVRPSPADTISLSHQYRRATFSDPDRPDRGFSTQGAIASWSKSITPELKMIGNGGFSVLSQRSGIYPVGGASLEWQGVYTTVRVSYSRAISPSFLFVSGALANEVVTGAVTRQMAEPVTLSLSANYAINRSIPDSSAVRFESYSVTPSVTYKIGPSLTASLSYTHSEFQRVFSGQAIEFNRNMVMLNLLAEWR